VASFQSQHEYKQQDSTGHNEQNATKETKKKKGKLDQLRLFTLRHKLLKISVDIQIAFSEETHPAEGQWLKEQLNMIKLLMFLVGT
jgi:hypothetical protein